MLKTLLMFLVLLPFLTFANETPNQQKTIEITKENSVSLRGPVTWASISTLQQDILRVALTLRSDEPIYLVLDTPGGSVMAGEMFIETLKGIPNPVHSVVLFAASMGFQITQATQKRYILSTGILMSHRATVGIQGQLNGELESQLELYTNMITKAEERSASRVGLSLEDYQKKILNEWWLFGQNAVSQKAADEVVVVRCSGSITKGLIKKIVYSFFGGSRELTYSSCPLITTPISQSKSFETTEDSDYFDTLLSDKRTFIDKYVKTGKVR